LIDRGDAEFWVQRKDAEAAVALAQKEAAIARRDAIRFRITAFLTVVGVCAASLAALEGWLALKQ
jgi:hypothetical protein